MNIDLNYSTWEISLFFLAELFARFFSFLPSPRYVWNEELRNVSDNSQKHIYVLNNYNNSFYILDVIQLKEIWFTSILKEALVKHGKSFDIEEEEG